MESSTRTALDPDLLLAQTDWVQRLARRLVADEERARDVAQDVFLTALERPPERASNEKSLRAWLARVVRSIVHVGTRSEARRRLRESNVARPPQSDSAADTVARAAQLQLVVDTVMEIEEPYRSALLMTYFDGLSAAEAGVRLGASEVAIRKRVSRGLQRLRDKLDRMHGGDRTAWVSALVPWLRWHEPAAPAAGASVLGIGTKIAAALLAAGVGTFVLEGVWRPEVEPVGPRLARVAGFETSARSALAPPAQCFALTESAASFGWLNVVADASAPVAWSLEDDGRVVGDVLPVHPAAAVLRVPVDRELALVGIADRDRSRRVELTPFAPGEVRDLVVRFDRPALVTERAADPLPEADDVRSEGASSQVAEAISIRRARHVRRPSEPELVRRSYVALGSGSAAARPGASAESSEGVETWGMRVGSSTGSTSDDGSRFYSTQSYAFGTGLATTSPSDGLNTNGPNRLQNLFGSGAMQALTAAGSTGSTSSESGRVVAVDATTGWPTWATVVARTAGDRAMLMAVTADGRIGVVPLRGDRVPVVVVREPARLRAAVPVGATDVTVEVGGVPIASLRADQLAGGLLVPSGDVHLRFAASGETLGERALRLEPAAR